MHVDDKPDNADAALGQRLFFALLPDTALRNDIARTLSRIERDNASDGRGVNPDRYHLTLQFLGDFRPLGQSVVDAAIVAADAVRVAAFDLVLDRAAAFPVPAWAGWGLHLRRRRCSNCGWTSAPHWPARGWSGEQHQPSVRT